MPIPRPFGILSNNSFDANDGVHLADYIPTYKSISHIINDNQVRNDMESIFHR